MRVYEERQVSNPDLSAESVVEYKALTPADIDAPARALAATWDAVDGAQARNFWARWSRNLS